MVALVSKSRSILLFVLDVLVNLVVIATLVIVLRVYIISPFRVHGPSMCDTFNSFDGRCIRGNGEYIMIYKLGYQNFFGWQVGLPQRGDVVVFRPPHGEEGEYYIKRIIGLPRDTVELRDGYVYVVNEEHPKGWKLDESFYLNEQNWGHTEPGLPGDTIYDVPDGEYFLLGDNRRASSDARRCFSQSGCSGNNTPFVQLDLLQGKAWIVLWPFDQVRLVKMPEY